MRITIILPSLLPGGAEHQTLTQVKEFINRGIDVQLIVLSDKLNLIDKIDENCNTVFINEPEFTRFSKKTIFKIFSYQKAISNAILTFDSDIIIANLPTAHFIARYLKFFNKKISAKLFNYHHSTQYKINPVNTLPKKIINYLNQLLSRADNGNIYISKAVKEDIENNFPAKNGVVIYNAIPTINITSKFEQEVLDEYTLSKNKYLIIPGRLHAVKGHRLFIESTKELIRDWSLNVVFVGHGPEKNNLQELTKNENLDLFIQFTGYVENKKMLALIKNASFVIIPSLEEGLGNIAIESLMMGKTILASNAGGLPEVIDDKVNGYIFERGNHIDLKETFSELINNLSERLFKAEDQTKSYKDRFTLTSQIDKILDYVRKN